MKDNNDTDCTAYYIGNGSSYILFCLFVPNASKEIQQIVVDSLKRDNWYVIKKFFAKIDSVPEKLELDYFIL